MPALPSTMSSVTDPHLAWQAQVPDIQVNCLQVIIKINFEIASRVIEGLLLS